MLNCEANRSNNRVYASNAGGTDHNEDFVVLFEKDENLLHFFLTRKNVHLIVFHAFNVVKAFLVDLRLTVFHLFKYIAFAELLVMSLLIGDHEFVRFAVYDMALTAAFQVVLALGIVLQWLLEVALLIFVL